MEEEWRMRRANGCGCFRHVTRYRPSKEVMLNVTVIRKARSRTVLVALNCPKTLNWASSTVTSDRTFLVRMSPFSIELKC